MSIQLLESATTANGNDNIVLVKFRYQGDVWTGVVDFTDSAVGQFREAVNAFGEVLYVLGHSVEEQRAFEAVVVAARAAHGA